MGYDLGASDYFRQASQLNAALDIIARISASDKIPDPDKPKIIAAIYVEVKDDTRSTIGSPLRTAPSPVETTAPTRNDSKDEVES